MSATRQPFELPDFYVGWPPRLNAHLETVRTHTKEWAREVGILDTPGSDNTPEIWSEQRFDGMDFALLAAYIYPDAPADELDLLADWCVWIFYLDDHFVQVYARAGDDTGGRAHLRRVPLFMLLDLADTQPEPTNPVERGLQDLWMRTVPSKSVDWRRRFYVATTRLLEGFAEELRSTRSERLPNPIEYIEMRREFGGAQFSAVLVEHSTFIELPERIVESRPIRVLTECIADVASMRNDVLSYDREVDDEGALANCVVILERFFDLTTQEAAEITSDIAASRMHQFENTAATEVPAMFEECALTPSEREAVALYVKGLQDWQAGSHEWHMHSSRYTSEPARDESALVLGRDGLGYAAVRAFRPTPRSTGLTRLRAYAHEPLEAVGPTRMPDVYMPFAARVSPHVPGAELDCVEWAQAMGMVAPGEGGRWMADELAAHRFALFMGAIYPDATVDELNLAARWAVWTAYSDDVTQRVSAATGDLAGAKIVNARLSLCMPLDCVSLPPATNPLEAGLTDLWIATATPLSLEDRHTLKAGVESMTASWLWELQNHVQQRIPDPVDYTEMRRGTSGADLFVTFARFRRGGELSPELYATRPMLALERAAQDHTCLANDIFSYRKEIEFEGALHNAVLVVRNFLGIATEPAVLVVNDLMTARVEQFEQLAATELPRIADELALDEAGRDALEGWVQGLQDLMAGSLLWHRRSERYDEARLRDKPLPGTLLHAALHPGTSH